jgi:acetyl esterase/lipase
MERANDGSTMKHQAHRISTLIAFRILPTCLLLWAAAGADETKSWTREADGRKIEARLKNYDPASGKVTLVMPDGKSPVIDAKILIGDDRTYLEAWARQRAEALEASKEGRLESFTPDGQKHKVHIYKPPGYVDGDESNTTRPACVLYSADGNALGLVHHMQPVADELGWVLVGIDAYMNTSSVEERFEERLADTKAAFAAASARVVFDPKKIVFGGGSGGGWWSYVSAAEITKDAAGILSFCGWMGKMHDRRYSRNMAVAMLNGDKDENANNWGKIDGDFLRKSASAKVREFPFPGGHEVAPQPVTLEAARWIHETRKFPENPAKKD